MQSYKRLTLFLFTLSTFLFSPITLAYVKYTYTSDSLNWKNSYFNGYDTGYPLGEKELVKFDFSFEVDESLLSKTSSTMFMIKDAELVPVLEDGDWWKQPTYDSKVRGRVEINPDKTIKYWYVLFDVNVYDLSYDEEFNTLAQHKMTVNSFGGANTCNCDLLQDRTNVITRRGPGWVKAFHGENRYGNRSSFDNWTITHYVPEANGLALAAIGLLGLVAIRRQKSK